MTGTNRSAADGDRVRVNRATRYSHLGALGTVVASLGANRHVRLDSGPTINVDADYLTPVGDTVHEAVAPHVAERIARGQDMLGRLGQRQVYEPNYATEKLADTARSVLEACAILGMEPTHLIDLSADAIHYGANLRQRYV